MSSKRIAFSISPSPFPVFIALVTCDIDYHTRLFDLPQCLEEMHRPHDVTGVCFDRILVATTYDSLGSHVNDHFRLALGYRRLKPREIANIPVHGADNACNLGLLEQARLGRWVKS